MKLLRDRMLTHWAAYLLAGMVVFLSAEYFILRHQVEKLEQVEEQKNYARSIQLGAQQIALMLHELEDGSHSAGPEIIARLDEQSRRLQILKVGGRIEETNVFINPLSRLPRITYDQLWKGWVSYSDDIRKTIANPGEDSTALMLSTLLPARWITLNTWYDRLEKDLAEVVHSKKQTVENWGLGFLLADVLLMTGLFFVFRKHVIGPIREMRSDVANYRQKAPRVNNEIGSVTEQINDLLEQLKDARDFVAAISTGNLDLDYRTLDANHEPGKNALADALIAMQNKLKDLNAEEQRRQWANEGLARFVDILRSSDDNLSTLGDRIVSALVKYTGSNQGGLYILNDDDEASKHLELVSLFAFDIKKHEHQKLKLGQGLLGQTFLEKETTVLTEIPDEYIRITSGLGMANPRALLMVPLKVDTEVYGIVELASFRNYMPHEIEFVEKLAETIASTLASVKVAQKNRNLIEQFQAQTEQMRAQEEEMRQNMEELQATQEEMARKEKDYLARIQELEERLQQAGSREEVERISALLREQEAGYKTRIQDLQDKIDMLSAKGDDWAVAEEVSNTLKFHLEALRITQEPAK